MPRSLGRPDHARLQLPDAARRPLFLTDEPAPFAPAAFAGTLPPPVGSAAPAEARDYLLHELSSLAVTGEVQRVAGVSRRTGAGLNAGTVENVLARQKGTTAGPAVLLVGHYDSVPTGTGASD